MADIWSEEKRSAVMARIRAKDTKPEKLLRSELHIRGWRFRLHRKDLPGKPDIVLPRYKTAVFVHGCFWHQHKDCIDGKVPKTRKEYWEEKFRRTAERDVTAQKELRKLGWKPVVLWECEIEKNLERTVAKLEKRLSR